MSCLDQAWVEILVQRLWFRSASIKSVHERMRALTDAQSRSKPLVLFFELLDPRLLVLDIHLLTSLDGGALWGCCSSKEVATRF